MVWEFSSCLFLWWYEWFSDALYPSRQFILIYDQSTFCRPLWPFHWQIGLQSFESSKPWPLLRKFVIQPWLFSQLSALLSACSLSRRFHELPYSIEFNKNLNSKNIQDKWTSRRIDLVGTILYVSLIFYASLLFKLLLQDWR